MGKVAFVTGANGITGSAIAEHISRHSTHLEWSQLIVTSRSPLQTTVRDDRLSFVALDFSKTPDELVGLMSESCRDVTHAYFSSYVHKDDFAELNSANKSLFENFLTALLRVAKKLENVTLQTGGKYYNVHLGGGSSPCREDDPRSGKAEDNFYYPQEDFLAEQQKGQSWSWNVIRPEAIIGYTLKPNGMNSALTCAMYLLVCKQLGQEARMPTNSLYWAGPETQSDAPHLAAFTLWASTTPKCANQAFNLTNGDTFIWQNMWPRLAAWFSASATSNQQFNKPPPEDGVPQQDFSLAEWAKDKRQVWEDMCERAGVPEAKATFGLGTWAFQDLVFMRSWNVTLSFDKARDFGWTGSVDNYDSLIGAFTRFRELKQIP